MDFVWLMGAYVLGSMCTHFIELVDHSIITAKNKELEKENIILSDKNKELIYNMEGNIKKLTIEVLMGVIETLQKSTTKETK